uniref:Uncharacterized protein n=1 Tax=Fusarium oxysporum (strain Fo5176) TaxID=660025 RepID=A0A0D2Y5D9_FUSOF
MALLNFTLSEEGVSAFRDALICLNKFSDDVSLEARKDSICDDQVLLPVPVPRKSPIP